MHKPLYPFASRWGAAELATLVFATVAFGNIACADPLRSLDTLGNAHKSVGLISHYQINTAAHSLDVVAAVPGASPIGADAERRLADDTAREMCSEGTAEGLSGWSVRIFMPGETTPTGSCRIGARH